MNSERSVLSLTLPDRKTQCSRPSKEQNGTLADWLAEQGFALNTRCGGKGVCRGCSIKLDDQTVRSCQIRASEISDGKSEISIPQRSLHNEKLDGVSIFEIGRKNLRYNRHPGVGLSLDIGTTTVAGALWDLSSGKCLATATRSNAQRRHGDNVLARIDFAIQRSAGVKTLQATLINGSLNPLVDDLLRSADLPPDAISEGIASGNTVMLHTLIGAPLNGFSAFPFRASFLEGKLVVSKEIGLHSDFPLKLVPSFGAFVGGDILAGALASGITEETGPSLLIDFGTNGEILLKSDDKYLTTATAAGPAFEGGRLNCGSPAAPGVIGGLSLQRDEWIIEYIGTSNRKKATGISGAAYIDFLGEARASGILSPMGRFNRDHPLVSTMEIDNEEESVVLISQDLFISEADIAELMQAKAAILGGALTLMEEEGLSSKQLHSIYVAGGFGYHLNPSHAVAIGLLPEISRDKIHIIGNSSLAGASLLLQAELHKESQSLIDKTRVVELNQIETFEDNYIDAMTLDPA